MRRYKAFNTELKLPGMQIVPVVESVAEIARSDTDTRSCSRDRITDVVANGPLEDRP